MKFRVRIPAIAKVLLIGVATVVSVLVALSIHTSDKLQMMDIGRINLKPDATHGITQVRFGVWGFCLHRTGNGSISELCDVFTPCDLTGTTRLCSKDKYGYSFSMTKPGQSVVESIGPDWTKAFPLQVATAILMCFSFILTLIPGRDVKIARLCVYALTLLLCMANFLGDFAFTYHMRVSVGGGLSTLGLGSNSLLGIGMVLQIIVGALLFCVFIYDYFMEGDRVPVVYPILLNSQAESNTGKPFKKRLLEIFGANSWRGLRVSLGKKLELPNWLHIRWPKWRRHSSGGNNSNSTTDQLPKPVSSPDAPPRKVFANDKELSMMMKGIPGVFKKAATVPESKRPRLLRL